MSKFKCTCETNQHWNKVQQEYGEAYEQAMERYNIINNQTPPDSDELITLHSCESLSTMPRNEYMLDLMKLIYEKCDVHVIMIIDQFQIGY